MAIRFYCPLGHPLAVPDHRAGKKGRCPICQQKVYVPVADPKPSGKAGGRRHSSVKLDEALSSQLGVANTPMPAPAGLPPGATNRLPILDPPKPATESEPKSVPVSSRPTTPNDSGIDLGAESPTAMLPPSAPRTEPSPADSPRIRAFQPEPLDPTPWLETPPTPPAVPSLQPPSSPPAPASAPVPQAGLPLEPPSPPPPTPPMPPRPPEPRIAFSELPAPLPSTVAPLPATPTSQRWLQTVTSGMDVAAYRIDERSRQTVYMLAGALAAVAIFGAVPALRHVNFAQAADWVQILWLLTAAHIVFVLWLISLPDRGTLWIGMLWCAGAAALYGGGMALVLGAGPGKLPPLDLASVRNTAGGWCAANILLLGTLCYIFGRTSANWQRTRRR